MHWALLLAVLAPQDRAIPDWSVRADADAIGTSARVELQSPDQLFRISVGGFGRFSWPFGAAEDPDAFISGNTIVIPDHLRYSDLFDSGTGVSVEATLMFFVPAPSPFPPATRDPEGVRAGLYVSLQSDSYEGDRSADGAAFIDPSDLDVLAAFVGLKVAVDLGGGGWGEVLLGAGVVRYESVDARVALAAGGVETQELFEDSQAPAVEFRYRFSARLGPLGFVGGMGLRFMGGPDEAGSALGNLFDTHPFWTYDLDLGLELGF